MEKYHGFDQVFYDYLFEKIVTDGGLRLQIIASELGFYHHMQSISCRASTLQRILLIFIASNTEISFRL